MLVVFASSVVGLCVVCGGRREGREDVTGGTRTRQAAGERGRPITRLKVRPGKGEGAAREQASVVVDGSARVFV